MTISTDMRVLVTGGTGLIGQHAVAGLLVRGYEVHVATRDATVPPHFSRDVRLHVGDLLDHAWQSTLMQRVRPTHLLHLAWYTSHGKFWTAAENLEWVQASLGLLTNFAAVGGRRVVGAGTCAEYTWSSGLCSEHSTPAQPATLYGTCKHALHEMFEAYGRLHALTTAWGRVFYVYGPQEHPARFVPSLMLPLLQGKAAECRCGDHVRDFMHVADVGDAFAALVDSDLAGPVNIASGSAVRLGDLAEAIAHVVGQPHLLKVGSEAATAGNPAALLADTRRLNVELGWTPRVDLDRGLSDAAISYQQQLELTAGRAASGTPVATS